MMDGLDEANQLGTSAGLCNGLVNQELLLQNEYLAAENQTLRAHLPVRFPLTDPERSSLAEIGNA
jgi:hypothetical protein